MSPTTKSHLLLWGGFALSLIFGSQVGFDPAHINLATLADKYPQLGAAIAGLVSAWFGASGLRKAPPPVSLPALDTPDGQRDVVLSINAIVAAGRAKKDQAMIDAAIECYKLASRISTP